MTSDERIELLEERLEEMIVARDHYAEGLYEVLRGRPAKETAACYLGETYDKATDTLLAAIGTAFSDYTEQLGKVEGKLSELKNVFEGRKL